MNIQTRLKTRGFTIIEVVLVLAIAALIFLMVFIALPALQAGQRDTARKQDVGTVASQVTTFTSNNRGAFPTSAQLTAYTTGKLSTNSSTITVHAAGTTATGLSANNYGTIIVTPKTMCGNGFTGALSPSTNASAYTVATVLEQGGPFCQDS